MDALKPKQLLLVLDNCEHLVTACAQLAAALLCACPRLRILATSREGLNIPGETIYCLAPLAVPNEERLPPMGALSRIAAVHAIESLVTRKLPHLSFL